MQIGKLINKIMAPPLAKEGFSKFGSLKRNKYEGVWEFAKPVEGHRHMIQIQSQTLPQLYSLSIRTHYKELLYQLGLDKE